MAQNKTRLLSFLLAALIGLGPIACSKDSRISLDELALRERDLTPQSQPASGAAPLALTDFQPYRIRPGDILSIRMIGLFEERYQPTTVDVRVYSDGDISLPEVGKLKVGGLTFDEAELAVISAHVPKYVTSLSVFIQLSTAEATTVIVQGAVNAPGLVKLNQNQRNLLYALAGAGGFSTTSSGKVHYRPIDPQKQALDFNVNDINDVRRMLSAAALEPGDVIDVESAAENAIYVHGLVNRAGPIIVPPRSRLSVMRALAAAGGFPEYLSVKEATLVRRLEDGSDAHVKLPLGDILAGTAPDVELRPGDILTVPYTTNTFLQQWAKNNLLVGPFNIGLRYDPLAQYNAERALDDDDFGGNSVSNAIRQSLGSSIPGVVVPPVQTNP